MLRVHSPLSEEHEGIVSEAVDVGYTVHTNLGPGFREHIYERAYCLELDSRGISFECEKKVSVRYKSWEIPGQKIDLIIEGVVLIEIKAVQKPHPVHRAQVLSYLKTIGLRVGLLMNFNVEVFKAGVRRVVLWVISSQARDEGEDKMASCLRAFVPSCTPHATVTRVIAYCGNARIHAVMSSSSPGTNCFSSPAYSCGNPVFDTWNR